VADASAESLSFDLRGLLDGSVSMDVSKLKGSA